MDVYLRYCPRCGEEYQPHMVTCVECGHALKDMIDGEDKEMLPQPGPPPEEPLLPPGDYRPIAYGLSSAAVAELMEHFESADIPVKIEERRNYGLSLGVRSEDKAAAMAILEREGTIPMQPDASAPAVGAEGGPCPACGTRVEPGSESCPDCGLRLTDDASDGVVCMMCGAPVSDTDDKCAACGARLEGA